MYCVRGRGKSSSTTFSRGGFSPNFNTPMRTRGVFSQPLSMPLRKWSKYWTSSELACGLPQRSNHSCHGCQRSHFCSEGTSSQPRIAPIPCIVLVQVPVMYVGTLILVMSGRLSFHQSLAVGDWSYILRKLSMPLLPFSIHLVIMLSNSSPP